MAPSRRGGARMTNRPPRATNPGKPSRIDTSTAHSARIYNYWLGGKDNFPADREAAEAAMAANPGIVADVRANRAFLARAVRYLVADAGVRQFLDLGQPVALMLLIILHLIPDAAHPERIVGRLMSALPAGSYLVISHPARDIQPAAMAEMTRRVNERMRGAMATLRTHDEVAALFGGLKMIEPGVVQPQQWRPDPATETPTEVTAWCGVALKS